MAKSKYFLISNSKHLPVVKIYFYRKILIWVANLLLNYFKRNLKHNYLCVKVEISSVDNNSIPCTKVFFSYQNWMIFINKDAEVFNKEIFIKKFLFQYTLFQTKVSDWKSFIALR